MKKTGIMGGTFNPIHIGHLILAEKAREQFLLDEVLFLPSGIPYMKDSKEVLPGKIRMEMTALAIQENPFFAISGIEVEREGRTYTYETMETLREQNPGTEYYFILGADSLWMMENWKNPERIFAACHILAAVRDGRAPEDMEKQAAYLNKKFDAGISLLGTENIGISSSMIRRLRREGKSIRYLVPEAVYDYIMKNGLYGELEA
ncbi:MAG: nicotinate-nucleotide adenylyltransferase [Bacteroides fragilis]|nr:nicotinate-nucleotide adenylyltransferase [Bacteroides fragilis]